MRSSWDDPGKPARNRKCVSVRYQHRKTSTGRRDARAGYWKIGEYRVIHAKIALQAEVDPRRREPRTSACAEVALRQLGQNAVEGRLINISSRGFMVETDALIETGSRVWLTLPGAGRINGLVLWSKNGRVGGELAEPLDPLAVIQAVGESRP